jgi:fatty acid desaturase
VHAINHTLRRKRWAIQGIYICRHSGMIRSFLFLWLFLVLLGVWVVGWLAFHIAGGLIHLLLIVAVISLILHLFHRTRSI